MIKRRWRRWSTFFVALVTVGAALVTAWLSVGVGARLGHPEKVSHFHAVATFDVGGDARVVETIDYHFAAPRHGIYRILPSVPWAATDSVEVGADHSDSYTVAPDIESLRSQMAANGVTSMTVDPTTMRGVRVRIGDPNHTVSGDHRYAVRYPLDDLRVKSSSDGTTRFGWDGVGASWEVPIERTELDLVAPWQWEQATCDVGNSGSIGGCTVTQSVPGRLEVSHGRLAAGEGVTVYAARGAPLTVAPAARRITFDPTAQPWWQATRWLVAGVAAAMLLGALITGRVLRLAGRDLVLAGASGAGAAADLAYEGTGGTPVIDRTHRVDEAKLARWATTEFAPPRGLEAWQGGVIVAENNRPEHRVAWLLSAAASGHINLEEAGPGSFQMRWGEHPPDDTTSMLEIAFHGRDRVRLGGYDPSFSALWMMVGAVQHKWLASSPYLDHRAESRARHARVIGSAAVALAAAGGIAATITAGLFGLPAIIAALAAAAIGGTGLALLTRAWELRARTPAGSAMWLRVESFRRFLAASEAEHVRQAAERGVLREYAAWAVALGEADHWNAAVEASGLAPETVGVSSTRFATGLTRACVATTTSPHSGSSSGGSSSSSHSSSSSGVGGGGGGGGGGSW